jgi:pyrroloquinoline-quinone synthase
MTANEFLDQLDTRIAKYDLLCHPFYKAWSASTLTREDLQAYGRDYFHHVEQFPAYLKEFGAHLQDDQLRRAVEINREDELGADGDRSHAELWLDFVQGMGGKRSASEAPVAEITDLVRSFHSVARDGAPEEALAAFYAYESQVPRVSAEKARGLREMYGADEKTCRYFAVHAVTDVYHSRIWKHQLMKVVDGNPQAADRALNAAERSAKALWRALDGIEAARLTRVQVS